jgi:hypothetical protein
MEESIPKLFTVIKSQKNFKNTKIESFYPKYQYSKNTECVVYYVQLLVILTAAESKMMEEILKSTFIMCLNV